MTAIVLWHWQVVAHALDLKKIQFVSLASAKQDRHSNLETFKTDPNCSVLLIILSTMGEDLCHSWNCLQPYSPLQEEEHCSLVMSSRTNESLELSLNNTFCIGGAAGLTLTEADTVILMEPSLSLSLEAQAAGRIQRLGK